MAARKRKKDTEAVSPHDVAVDSAFCDESEESTDSVGRAEAENGPVDVEVAVESIDEPADLEAQIAELADRNLRLQAEMENVRQRTAREIATTHRYAAMPLARDLLDVVDNVDRAIEAAEKATDARNLLEGFQLVAQQLQAILAKHRCLPIKAEGTPFDPSIHEAIQQMPSDEQPAGSVMLVTQVGYQLHDRVVRPSQVIVSTGPQENPEEVS